MRGVQTFRFPRKYWKTNHFETHIKLLTRQQMTEKYLEYIESIKSLHPSGADCDPELILTVRNLWCPVRL